MMNNDVTNTTGGHSAEMNNRDLGVLVGFDASAHSRAALRFAATEAQRRKTVLTVVTAYAIPVEIYPNLASMPKEHEDTAKKKVAQDTLELARKYLRDYTGETIFGTAQGDAAGVFVDFSSRAQLVVVGARGRGGFAGRILGSVAAALPAHSRCPSVVVTGAVGANSSESAAITDSGTVGDAEVFVPTHAQGPVVAAIDGSERSAEVVRVAADAAERNGAGLTVLMAMPLIEEWLYWYPELRVDDEASRKRRVDLEEAVKSDLAWLRDAHPTLDYSVSVEIGDPADLIVRQTGKAQLTVVGTRGRGAVRSAILGSVSRAVLNQAQGPIMVVPGR
ncbi:universal stress protein [Brevibacterium sp. ZH18]|uniref:universal stress protein n=1 Tax=Brevibacterium sp. ZH18 TaxID=2927784 RepID=UPI001F6253B4|nr:universal stress protein [Brevibacterium sp. ZH18]MCI4011204.1 universal stress protein [Brevibacterium sp. ZH18]